MSCYVIKHLSCLMLYNMITCVILCYKTIVSCVMLYNMCHMLCYITFLMLCYITHVMLCYITSVKCYVI